MHLRKQVCSKESLAQSGVVCLVSYCHSAGFLLSLKVLNVCSFPPGQVIQHLLHHGSGWTEISFLCNQITGAESKGDMMPCVHTTMGLSSSLPRCLFFHMCSVFLLSLLSVVAVFLKDIGSLFLTLVTFIPITHP